MTTTATEEAPTAAIPLNSLQALMAWREHKEAGLRAPLTRMAQSAVEMVHAANMRAAMDEKAAYLEPLPKRVPGDSMPYSVNPYSPEPASDRTLASSLPGPLPLAEAEAEEAATRQQEASTQALARWAPGETLADESLAEMAVERVLHAHDTDPAGEPAVDAEPGDDGTDDDLPTAAEVADPAGETADETAIFPADEGDE